MISTFERKLASTIDIPYIIVENNDSYNYFTAKYNPIFYQKSFGNEIHILIHIFICHVTVDINKDLGEHN